MKKLWIICFFIAGMYSAKAQEIVKWKIDNLDQYIRESDGILVINFWATFCKPCVAEIPGFIATVAQHKDNVKLLLVSVDMQNAYPQKLKDFIAAKKWKGQFIWLNETNADHFCPHIDASWSGSIPATLVVNQARGIRVFHEGEMTVKELEAAIQKAKGPSQAPDELKAL